MSKKACFLLLVLYSSMLCAQDVSLKSGEEFENKYGPLQSIIGENKDAFYTYRNKRYGNNRINYVQKYNRETFKLEWEKLISFEKELGNVRNVNLIESMAILFNNKVYIFL